MLKADPVIRTYSTEERIYTKTSTLEWGPCALCDGIQNSMEAILAWTPSSIHKMTGLGGKMV